MPPTARISKVSIEERVAWYAVLLLPALVPITVGIIPFSGALSQNPYIYPKILVLALLVVVAATAHAIGVFRRVIFVRSVPGAWWLAGFLGLAALSTAAALSPSVAFFGGKYQRVGLMVILLTAAAFVLTVQLVTGQRRMRALAVSTVAGGVVVAGVTILQSRTIDPFMVTGKFLLHRGPSLLGNPDFTATYLIVPAVLAVTLALSARTASTRVASWTALTMTVLAITISLTRGAWLGTAVGIAAVLVVAWRAHISKRGVVGLLGVLALVVILAIAIRGPESFAARFSDLASRETIGGSRVVLWTEALSVIEEHPLLGTGPDSYYLGWYRARTPTSMRLSGVDIVNDDPHNLLLLLLATLGVPAGLTGAGIVIAPLLKGARLALAQVVSTRLLYTGWWASLLGLLVGLFFAPNVVVLTLMLALVGAVVLAPRTKTSSVRAGVAQLLTLGLALSAVALFVVSVISLSADARLNRAQAAGDAAIATAAAEIAPWHAEAQYRAAYAHALKANSRLALGDNSSAVAAVEAEERLRSLVSQNPQDYASQILLAHFLAQRGAIEGDGDSFLRARAAAIQASSIYPLSPEAAFYRAITEVNLDDERAAISTLEPLWDIDPRYAKSGTLYAETLLNTGERAEAVRVVGILEERFPNNPSVRDLAARLDSESSGE